MLTNTKAIRKECTIHQFSGLSIEIENTDAAEPGPKVRIIETTICATPFVAPRDPRLGEEAAM